MKLISNETELIKTPDNILTITNFRIVKFTENSSGFDFHSIFLDKISSVKLLKRSNPNLLIIGALITIACVFTMIKFNTLVTIPFAGNAMLILGLLTGILISASFFWSLKHFLEINSIGSEKMDFNLGKKSEEVYKILFLLQQSIQLQQSVENQKISYPKNLAA